MTHPMTLRLHQGGGTSNPTAVLRAARRISGQRFYGHPEDQARSWGGYEIGVAERRVVQVQCYDPSMTRPPVPTPWNVYRFVGVEGWWYEGPCGITEFRADPDPESGVAVLHHGYDYWQGTETPRAPVR